MKIAIRILSAAAAAAVCLTAGAINHNPQAVADLLDRVGGQGTAARFETAVDESLAQDGKETFVITSSNGKPCIKGSTLSALTTGIGWYLNHTANVNLSWNNMTTDLGSVSLPVPAGEEKHTTSAQYRYYLNYTAFSYSMSTWTWERWQREIDWMALHGINMPLQIIGLEEVWRKLLTEDYGYTSAEANDFIGGPSFMAWFGMNNLQGHGGPNPDWWYERQAEMGRKMSARMRELGIEPVLPGFAGMVPSNFTKKTGIAATSQGNWCGFVRPYILDATGSKFPEVARKYYARLKEVMGESQYYSIDPFHEGGATPANVDLAYQNLYKAMDEAKPGSQFVIQSWQWSAAQRKCLDNIPQGKLLVLDLYSDGRPGWTSYKGHETVYCTIFNFGGRTGFFGRFNGIINGYFDALNTASVKGIGAAPEAIEQTPVMYDLLFELPWIASKPNAAQWMADYATRRYGTDSHEAREAWELLRISALDCKTALQGPHEAIVCARPALTVNKVSSWGGAEIFYDRSLVAGAAYKLLDANLSGENYSYDLADISRQALTDYSKSLLNGMREADAAGDAALFAKRRDAFLQLILDIDRLLSTNSLLTLGNWTERARAMADESAGTTDADRNWLELNNARTIITTWGPQAAAEGGGLRDYSYREWGGMMKDFYYQRWKLWFDNGMKAPSGGWFNWEWNWAHTNPGAYSSKTVGDTRAVAAELLPKYMSRFYASKVDGGTYCVIDRMLANDARTTFVDHASPATVYAPLIPGAEIAEIAIDFSKNTRYEANELSAGATFAIPADAPMGDRTARITLTDGTTVTYTLRITADITSPRTVSVSTADPEQGSVSIDGTNALSVTTTDYVTLRATARNLYDFDHWEDLAGNDMGNDNPMTYYGKEDASFKAFFVVNKWGVPDYNGAANDLADMKAYQQYVNKLSLIQGNETTELYTANECPEEHFVQIPTRIKAAPGGEFTFAYTQPGDGMKYLFLSAYVDLNNDGKFDPAAGELLGTIGTRNSTNDAVGAGSFTMLLPFDAVKATTHIRLRFDGAWGAGYDSKIKAFPADAPTNRVIYELMLQVVDSPDYTCTVTYGANNPAYGSMRSENESMIYNPGEEVIITAFPNQGCRVKRWVDNHGRELPAEWIADNGLSVNFKAYDNAHITAEFEPLPIEADGWVFDWEGTDNGMARLTGIVTEGNADLDLSATEPTVGAIASDLFKGNTTLKSVTLPDNELTAPGATIFSTKIVGDGTRNKQTALSQTISGTASWVMTINGTSTGASFNDSGSALYGNGTDALASDYSGGWSQIYLTKEGIISIKWDSPTEVKFSDVPITSGFQLRAVYDASKKNLTVTVSNGQKSQTQTLANTSVMKDISRFATAVPTGVNYTLTFTQPDAAVVPGELFRGCTSLLDFHCPDDAKTYTDKGGILYKGKTTRVWAYPEGRLSIPFTLRQSSTPVVANGDLTVSATANPANPFQALWTLAEGKLIHANTGLAMNADGTSISESGAAATYELTYASGMPSLKLTFGSTTRTYKFDDPMTTTIPVDGTAGICLPMSVIVPDGNVKFSYIESVSIADGSAFVDFQPGTRLRPATPVLVRGGAGNITVSIAPEADNHASSGKLQGSLTGATATPAVFALQGALFVKTNAIAANGVYIDAADVPAGLGDSFRADFGFTGIEEIEASTESERELYDLAGRRVVTPNPAPGLYITSNGQKIFISNK